jgi:hypothetical protein
MLAFPPDLLFRFALASASHSATKQEMGLAGCGRELKREGFLACPYKDA